MFCVNLLFHLLKLNNMTSPLLYNRKEFIVNCECGHGLLKINYYDGEDEKDTDVSIEYYVRAFDSNNILEILKNRIKLIWNILIGKEYLLYDIFLESKSEIIKFKEFVASIDESKATY